MIAFSITLPDWAVEGVVGPLKCLTTLKDRIAIVICFSQLNFENDTGGPFVEGIFERESAG